VTTLVRDGLEVRYEVLGGSGLALLLPHLNFSWPDYLDLSPLAERFTVITASPRGFADSSRLDASVPYRVGDMADDLIAVVQAVGFDLECRERDTWLVGLHKFKRELSGEAANPEALRAGKQRARAATDRHAAVETPAPGNEAL
jgi:hypothetical protein